MGNPNIDPRVAPHDASYLTNISFIVIMYVNHFSIIICEQHPFFFFFAVSSVSLTTLKLYI